MNEKTEWKLVPVTLTPEMRDAAVQAICYGPEGGFTRTSGPDKAWNAMLAASPSSKSTKEADDDDDWLVRVVSSGEYNFPLLEWRSANHSLETPIGTKLYARASSSIKEDGDQAIYNSMAARYQRDRLSPPSPLGDTPNTAHIRSVPGGAAFLRVAGASGDTPEGGA